MLGVTDILGVLLGVTDILGVLLGVTLGVKLIVGVTLGVTLIEGVILNDGVGVGVKGIQLLPTQVPKVSIIALPLTISGLLPHNVIDSLGAKARSCDATLSHRVYETNASSDDILVKLIQLHGYNGVVDGVGVTENEGVTLGVGVGATQSLIGVAVLVNERAPISSNQ
jgi:hypothetical protein